MSDKQVIKFAPLGFDLRALCDNREGEIRHFEGYRDSLGSAEALLRRTIELKDFESERPQTKQLVLVYEGLQIKSWGFLHSFELPFLGHRLLQRKTINSMCLALESRCLAFFSSVYTSGPLLRVSAAVSDSSQLFFFPKATTWRQVAETSDPVYNLCLRITACCVHSLHILQSRA